jgi:4-hydroxy-tetrahydrodipicolinate reductase
MFSTILQAVVLGIVQGLTEFIPISSSAHLIIIPWLFGWNDPALTSLTFDVALHLGTLLAVLVYFASDWIRMIRAWFLSVFQFKIGNDPDRRMAWFVLLGTIPGAIAGVLFESKIEALFHQPNTPIQPTAMIVMAFIIAGLGVFLFLADRLARHMEGMENITLGQALLIGLSQALAIFPGVSRSGSTITTGLALGLRRETAARFSFLLSAPIIAGAGLKSLVDIYEGLKAGSIARADLILFPIGFVVAAISGFLCIRFLMNYLQKHTLAPFVYYRWALAVLIFVVEALGLASTGLRIAASLEEALRSPADVLVDFTGPETVKGRALAALDHGVRVVIGTSGLSSADFDEIEARAVQRGLGAIAAGNFSITAALAKHFALIAARYLPAWEIIDYAQAEKPDAPSGTTRELAEALQAVARQAPAVPLEQTLGIQAARGATVAGTQVHSLRLPGYTISFETIFGQPDERLTIRHDSGTSAEPYVAGTLLAVKKVMSITGLVRGLDTLLFAGE